MTEDTEFGFFMNEKPSKLLVVARRHRNDIFIAKLAKKVDTTYAHASKTIGKLEDKGYLKKEKEGRKQRVSLTEEGREVADKIGEIMDVFGERTVKEDKSRGDSPPQLARSL